MCPFENRILHENVQCTISMSTNPFISIALMNNYIAELLDCRFMIDGLTLLPMNIYCVQLRFILLQNVNSSNGLKPLCGRYY